MKQLYFGKRFWLLLIVSFFGTGLISKKMPGTIGSLFAMLIVIVLPRSPRLLFLISSILFIVGVLACDLYITKFKYESCKDPAYIVIDEACGIFFGCAVIYCFWLQSILAVFINFLLFRLFDILKPFPIKTIEDSLKRNSKTVGFGIMIDDILAAIFASALQIIGGVLYGENKIIKR
ncbi:MAG: phosphatidylglycerophosphatase A [Holosporales bacterium]|jgi:phosphatidylglycerophosphatase A|nr:phosphatidylglycerophosphatase A [Holosporales bacterium]